MSIFKAYDIRGIYEKEVDLDTAEAIGVTFPGYVELMQSIGADMSLK